MHHSAITEIMLDLCKLITSVMAEQDGSGYPTIALKASHPGCMSLE